MENKSAADATAKPQGPAGPARWMVVDDDDSVRDFLADVLQMRGGAEIATFRSASEALAVFTAAPDKFQLVITDLDMPGMDGIEFCRRLRAVTPDLKVVLATGNGATTASGAKQNGFFGLLAKPFPAADVWRLVEAAGVVPQTAGSNARL